MTTYVLRTLKGDPVMSFDRLDRAKAYQTKAQSRRIPLRVWEVEQVERMVG